MIALFLNRLPWCSRHILCFLLTAVLLSGFAAPVLASVDKAQAKKDWEELAKLTTRYQREFMSQSYLKEKGEAFVDDWVAWKKHFAALMDDFKNRYGKTPEDVQKAFDGIQRPLDVNQDIRQVFNAANNIDIAKEEQKFSGWAVESGREAYNRWKNFTPEPTKVELKMDYAERALRNFKLAKALDPKGDYDDYIKEAQDAADKTRPEFEKTLKELNWPGHNPDYAGPGNPNDLAEAALDFLSKNPEWSKPEYDDEHIPVAACVTGKDWEVYKKAPLTEQPTQYSLNVFVAFAGKKDPKIAYGYHMVFYTREEAGVDKKPPFHYANSRQYAKYKMLMSNVPKGAGAADVPTAGGFGFLLRLVLAASLIVGGLIAAAPVVTGKVPQLSGVCDALSPLRGKIGIVALGIGLLCFLRALFFYFAPFTDLLPQAAAVILGLLLGKEILLRKAAEPAPTSAAGPGDGAEVPAEEGSSTSGLDQAKAQASKVTSKAKELLVDNQEKIEKLEHQEVRIGLISMGLGLIHLLVGGFWLF